MHFKVISKILGTLLMLFSMTLLPPIFVSLYYQDGSFINFAIAFAISFSTGFIAWLPFHKAREELRTRDGFLVTALFWLVLGSFGSLPFTLGNMSDTAIVDAVFESVSGLTTTGATIFTNIDQLPKAILYYRQQLQWLGGIGIIVIAVAVLPMLGIGGMQLYRAETPGPVKDSKLTPRITETAKALFLIYLSLTCFCGIAYYLAGMTLFDAIGHAYSTVAIGGFSTHDASMAHFIDKPIILIICMVFMVLSGINFALHFFAWRANSIWHYIRDPECLFYFSMLVLGLVVTITFLAFKGTYDLQNSIILGSFELISILTTTGFGVADFSIWPTFLPFFIFMFAFMGGCAGSTGGGMKMIRVLLIIKQGAREIQRLIHPNAVIPIKIGSKTVSDRVIEAVWGFFGMYVIAYLTLCVCLTATGMDFLTAFSAVGASINNLGPGLADVSAHYGFINSSAKWLLCFAMLLGRLEVFTLLVLFSPAFWRR